MKRTFSSVWKSSSQVRKQRKYRYNAPLHVKNTFLNTHLSKDLRAKHGMRSATIRKGDEVTVMRGSFAKKKARVSAVDVRRCRVVLEGITRTKKDGSKIAVFFRPHVLQLVTLSVDDKRRMKRLDKEHKEKKQNAPHTS